ncbi:hypothetical protein [Planctomyces sp. SH-PL62]|uniref:hypothetical protein n=1 Tax=Planctomyces sp. SH-PL62 TaxID=1636152 RepID=UPI00078DFCA6|nr:hypothetical protein [Planctomyces sp. SH-PL62]AMV38290.1 hypothetical protein VT85_12690 [Planctomyces sp. SH-PL62]
MPRGARRRGQPGVPAPRRPQAAPSALQAYFQYGRSIEDKLDRAIGESDDQAAPIAFAGWPDPQPGEDQPKERPPGADLLVAFYGMSFSNQMAEALKAAEPKVAVRKIGGPAAPPNHVMEMYEIDRGRHDADVVVFTVLDSSVGGVLTIDGACRNFEAPQPFMYRRYFATPEGLDAHEPPARSLAEFREAWLDPEGRARLIDELLKWDLYYSPFYFRKNFLDESSLARMIRRALFRSHKQTITGLYEEDGRFLEDSEAIRALKGMVGRFIDQARADGKRPLVLMVQDQASGSRLQDVLGPIVEARGALAFNTNAICPTSNRLNFVADGHFTPAANEKLAEALAELLRRPPLATADPG